MGFVLDIISKSGNSNELQNFAQSFKDVFATKDTHVFITEANTGNLADADYIVAISNAIKRGTRIIYVENISMILCLASRKFSFLMHL